MIPGLIPVLGGGGIPPTTLVGQVNTTSTTFGSGAIPACQNGDLLICAVNSVFHTNIPSNLPSAPSASATGWTLITSFSVRNQDTSNSPPEWTDAQSAWLFSRTWSSAASTSFTLSTTADGVLGSNQMNMTAFRRGQGGTTAVLSWIKSTTGNVPSRTVSEGNMSYVWARGAPTTSTPITLPGFDFLSARAGPLINNVWYSSQAISVDFIKAHSSNFTTTAANMTFPIHGLQNLPETWHFVIG